MNISTKKPIEPVYYGLKIFLRVTWMVRCFNIDRKLNFCLSRLDCTEQESTIRTCCATSKLWNFCVQSFNRIQHIIQRLFTFLIIPTHRYSQDHYNYILFQISFLMCISNEQIIESQINGTEWLTHSEYQQKGKMKIVTIVTNINGHLRSFYYISCSPCRLPITTHTHAISIYIIK